MSSRTSIQPTLPAIEQAASDEPAESRKRVRPSRETPSVRGLQVALGLLLLGLWQLAAAEKWPEPVLAKSPVQSWDYLVSTPEETLAKIGFPPGRKRGQLGFTFHA